MFCGPEVVWQTVQSVTSILMSWDPQRMVLHLHPGHELLRKTEFSFHEPLCVRSSFGHDKERDAKTNMLRAGKGNTATSNEEEREREQMRESVCECASVRSVRCFMKHLNYSALLTFTIFFSAPLRPVIKLPDVVLPS